MSSAQHAARQLHITQRQVRCLHTSWVPLATFAKLVAQSKSTKELELLSDFSNKNSEYQRMNRRVNVEKNVDNCSDLLITTSNTELLTK